MKFANRASVLITSEVNNINKFIAASSRFKAMWLLKWVIFILNIIYLYITLGKDDSFSRLLKHIESTFLASAGFHVYVILLLCVLLVFINWGIEAFKWKTLVNKFYRISYARSYKAILAGSAVSLWIPNRAGEYLGRVLYVRDGQRIKSVLATWIGSMSQLTVTLLLGIGGAWFYVYMHWPENIFMRAVPAMSLLLAMLILLVYFNLNKLRHLFPKKSWIGRVRQYLVVFTLYEFKDLARVLFLSLLRYTVFSSQFILLLLVFGAAIPLQQVVLSIFLIYLVQTVVPSTALTELGIRGAASVFFLKSYTENTAAILSASYGLWLINLILPGIIGVLLLLFFSPKNKKLGEK